MKLPDIVDNHEIVEQALAPYLEKFGPRAIGIRSHCYRMINFINYFAPASTREEIDKYAIYAAFHDLPVLATGNYDYLEPAADLTKKYLAANGKPEWGDELSLMIVNHHRITPYRGEFERTVEAARRADWIDMSLGMLTFDMPDDLLLRMNHDFPIQTLLPWPAWKNIFRYAMTHPDRPLPFARL